MRQMLPPSCSSYISCSRYVGEGTGSVGSSAAALMKARLREENAGKHSSSSSKCGRMKNCHFVQYGSCALQQLVLACGWIPTAQMSHACFSSVAHACCHSRSTTVLGEQGCWGDAIEVLNDQWFGCMLFKRALAVTGISMHSGVCCVL
jgi:hypothetical protein